MLLEYLKTGLSVIRVSVKIALSTVKVFLENLSIKKVFEKNFSDHKKLKNISYKTNPSIDAMMKTFVLNTYYERKLNYLYDQYLASSQCH